MSSCYNDCIVFLLAKAYQTAHRIFKSRLEAHGLTPVQSLVLEAIWDQEGLTVGEISSRVAVDYATLSSILERMSASGWVTKKKHPEDRRCWLVFLTQKSRDMKESLLAARDETNRVMTEKLSEPEKLLLFRMLKDLRETETSKQDVSE